MLHLFTAASVASSSCFMATGSKARSSSCQVTANVLDVEVNPGLDDADPHLLTQQKSMVIKPLLILDEVFFQRVWHFFE